MIDYFVIESESFVMMTGFCRCLRFVRDWHRWSGWYVFARCRVLSARECLFGQAGYFRVLFALQVVGCWQFAAGQLSVLQQRWRLYIEIRCQQFGC